MLENGDASNDGQKDRQRIGSEVSVTPVAGGFEMVELTVKPFVDGKPVDIQKEAALRKMDDLVDEMIRSEQEYVNELTSLVEVSLGMTE